MEATPRIELGIKVLQTSALPLGYVALKGGAENEIRTRDPLLGKEVLYHWAISALATRMGLEPTTSAVTGRHSNQLNHRANVSVSDSYIYYHTFCVLARGFLKKILEKVFQWRNRGLLQSRFKFEYHQKLHHSQTLRRNKVMFKQFEYHQKLHHSQTSGEV